VSHKELVEVIQTVSEDHDVKKTCGVLGFSCSSYYERLNRKKSNRSQENHRLSLKIAQIYVDNNRVYGAPKIHEVLMQAKEKVCLKHVQKLMRKNRIAVYYF